MSEKERRVMRILTPRVRHVYRLMLEGCSPVEVRIKVGTSRQSVHRHLLQIKRAENIVDSHPPSWTEGLGCRLSMVLCNMGIRTKQEAMEAVRSGRIMNARNFGKVSLDKLCKALGMDISRRVPCAICRSRGYVYGRVNSGSEL
jgi:hypothetical protein